MNITLKNVKHAGFASEETHCFSATVYIDGKRAFCAKNDGHGGCDDYYPADKKTTHKEVWEQIRIINNELGKEVLDHGDFKINNSLEIVVCDLVNEFLRDRDIKRTLRKVAYVKNGDIYIVNCTPTEKNLEAVKKQKWWSDACQVLNGMPIEQVRPYFK